MILKADKKEIASGPISMVRKDTVIDLFLFFKSCEVFSKKIFQLQASQSQETSTLLGLHVESTRIDEKNEL